MGPLECIGGAPQKNNGPKRSHQEQYSPVRWAHQSASAKPSRKIIGQSEANSSSIHQCYGPIQVHRQCLPETQWAKEKQSTAVSTNAMGPSKVPPRNLMGPSKAIVSSIC